MTQFSVPGIKGVFDQSTSLETNSLPGGGNFSSSDLTFTLNTTLGDFSLTSSIETVVLLNLNTNLGDFTLSAIIQNGDQINLQLDTSLGDFTLSSTLSSVATLTLYQSLGEFTPNLRLESPRNLSLNQNLGDFTPYLRIVLTPIPVASFDPFHDPYWIAVEFDLFDENDDPITVRIGNRGIIHRTVLGTLYNYLPRLSHVPIELGSTLTVTSYGSPVRGQENGGVISFGFDEEVWPWFGYRWIGQVFRVYFGKTTDPVEADVDTDLDLVYKGRIASIKHDTLYVTIQTTDESIQWDNPLVTDFYDSTFPVALRGKPKPFLWGYAFSIEPQIENEEDQIYAISYRPGGLDFIAQVRVGGIPWDLNVGGPPSQGEWTPDLSNGKFTLGSPPLGMDVRCDAQQGTFTIAGLIREIIENIDGEVDETYMGELDSHMPEKISFVTTTTPINTLDAIDDFVTNGGCWWGVGPIGKAIAGVIDVPATTAKFLLDSTNIHDIQLNTIHPPAKEIRVGFQRNWAPQTTFAPSVLETEKAKWKEFGQVYEPHFEDDTIQDLEPRAVKVPQLTGTFVGSGAAKRTQDRLIQAWGTVRSLYDVSAYIDLNDIVLYDTVAVNYMMVTGNFRITGAIRSVGLGPAKLQVWGTIGDFAVQAPEPLLPQGVTDVGIWTRSSGSGTFQVGVDCPSTVTRLWIRGVGGGGGGGGGYNDGVTFYGGGGGGSGGYFEDVITVTASSAINWEVGEGGAGMNFGSLGQASDGNDTIFGAAIGNGGGGGFVEVASTGSGVGGGVGGGSSGATVTFTGNSGGAGYARLLTDSLDVFTACGGGTPFGSGGPATSVFQSIDAAPGAGGGGHVDISSYPSQDGYAGLIIVIWFA